MVRVTMTSGAVYVARETGDRMFAVENGVTGERVGRVFHSSDAEVPWFVGGEGFVSLWRAVRWVVGGQVARVDW